jgi:succinyl-CoA synthetase alpha subunit
MAILVKADTGVLVQGITGREGTLHTRAMLAYGTRVLAGVTPGRGSLMVEGVPVYDTVAEAEAAHPAIGATVIFVPASGAADAVYEAVDAGLPLIVLITERIPVHDALRFIAYARSRGCTLIGPNCPGVISPPRAKLGIMPSHLFATGPVGVVSRSGTLTYEIAQALTQAGLGQSTALGIGGDPVTGLDFTEVLTRFNDDPDTQAVVVIGEIGGDAEERLAQTLRARGRHKPVVAFIAGRSAPPGKRMGHAGAIISMGAGTADSKREALRAAGIAVADLPSQIPGLVQQALLAAR